MSPSSVRQARARLARLVALAGMTLAADACGPAEVLRPASTDPVAVVVVSPAADNLLIGDSQQLIASVKDRIGRPLSGRSISWASLDPATAIVSPTGVVSGRSPGTARIVASSERQSGVTTISVLPTRSEAAECAAPKPEWIWCDDFEKDRLGSYFEYRAHDGDFVRVPGVGYGGSIGMRARFSRAGQVQGGFLHLAMGKAPSSDFRPVDAGTAIYREIYWRHFVKLQLGWVGGGGNKLSRAQAIVNRDWAQAMVAHVWSGVLPDKEAYHLGIVPATTTDESGRVLGTEYNDFPHFRWLGAEWTRTPIFDQTHVGKWYCVEAHAKLNEPGRSNGLFELWINGTLDARIERLNWQGAYTDYGINTVFLENYWNTGSPVPQERYFDNLVVSTQHIGC
jgi:hypothetical protein